MPKLPDGRVWAPGETSVSRQLGYLPMHCVKVPKRELQVNAHQIKKTARIADTPNAMFHCLKIIKMEDNYMVSRWYPPQPLRSTRLTVFEGIKILLL